MEHPTNRELDSIEMELRTHEVQCDERWRTTFKRLEGIEEALFRIEARTVKIGGGLIFFLASLLVTVLSGKII
jgi:hypothetical protein